MLITGLDVLLILLLQRWGFRYVEALVIALIGTIIAMFGVQMFLSRPEYWPVLRSLFIPSASIVTNPEHALHRHRDSGRDGDAAQSLSALVDCAEPATTSGRREGKREAIHMANVDSALALTLALFVNAAILIVAAAVFHRSGHFDVAAIQDAYKLLSPLLGAAGASTLFAVALLARGQNSSITGTLAGQVVMEGFIHLKVSPWLRRLITRGAGDYSDDHRGGGERRAGDGKAADPEPGDLVAAVELCGGAAGDVYRETARRWASL